MMWRLRSSEERGKRWKMGEKDREGEVSKEEGS